MRRWIIFLFTAHFLVNVMTFHVGPISSPNLIEHLAEHGPEPSKADKESFTVSEQLKHGLEDEAEDLPDDMFESLTKRPRSAFPRGLSALHRSAPLGPSNNGLDRPPRLG